jgi:two-component system, chemotaxis family, protein-glutamate methylesterase/glutaminase
MAVRDIIVVGTSAGGVGALSELAAALPRDLPAAVFVVLHTAADRESLLPEILSRAGALPAAKARHGEPIRPGRIYLAPPDHHLLLDGTHVRLSHGPRENLHRPAIDPLFRSAARHHGRRVIAAVLTGALADGTAGLMAVRAAGGVAVVEDPREAYYPDMPRNALEMAGADYVLPLARIGPTLAALTLNPDSLPPGAPAMNGDPMEQIVEQQRHDKAAQARDERRGASSVYTCPECGGVLWQVAEEDPLRFRCHVGHSYYGEDLLVEQAETLEAGLWVAVRTFAEKATLSRQLAARERQRGNLATAERFDDQARTADEYGQLIQKHVLNGKIPDAPPLDPGAEGAA